MRKKLLVLFNLFAVIFFITISPYMTVLGNDTLEIDNTPLANLNDQDDKPFIQQAILAEYFSGFYQLYGAEVNLGQVSYNTSVMLNDHTNIEVNSIPLWIEVKISDSFNIGDIKLELEKDGNTVDNLNFQWERYQTGEGVAFKIITLPEGNLNLTVTDGGTNSKSTSLNVYSFSGFYQLNGAEVVSNQVTYDTSVILNDPTNIEMSSLPLWIEVKTSNHPNIADVNLKLEKDGNPINSPEFEWEKYLTDEGVAFKINRLPEGNLNLTVSDGTISKSTSLNVYSFSDFYQLYGAEVVTNQVTYGTSVVLNDPANIEMSSLPLWIEAKISNLADLAGISLLLEKNGNPINSPDFEWEKYLTDEGVAFKINRLPVGYLNLTMSDGTISKSTSLNVFNIPDFKVAIDQEYINMNNQANLSFTISNAYEGENTTYLYTIKNNEGGDEITGTGTITSNQEQVSEINVSNLADGILKLHVSLVKPQGNVFAESSDTVEKITVPTADLRDLLLNHGTLSPTFDSEIINYEVRVSSNIHNIKITPFAVDPIHSLVQVNGEPILSGHPSNEIPLLTGSNLFEIVIIAQDGVTTKKYTINVIRESIGGSYSPSDPFKIITITPLGDTVSFEGATIVFPPNTVNKNTEIKLEKLLNRPIVSYENLVSEVYEFTKLKEDDFNIPINILLSFELSKIDFNTHRVSIYWLNEETNEWVELDNVKVDLKESTVSGEVDHFTKFAVLKTELYDEGYIKGFSDGTFKPEQPMTRIQMAMMLAQVLGYEESNLETKIPFKDISYNYHGLDVIAFVKEKGLMKGDEQGNFRPDDIITRAQMAAIVANYKGLEIEETKLLSFTDTSESWGKWIIEANYNAGLIRGREDGTFGPNEPLTRAQGVVMINRMFARNPLYGIDSPTYSDVSPSYWAFNHIEKASKDHYFIRGEGKDWIK